MDALVLQRWDHRGKAPAPPSLEQGTKSLSPHQGKPLLLAPARSQDFDHKFPSFIQEVLPETPTPSKE